MRLLVTGCAEGLGRAVAERALAALPQIRRPLAGRWRVTGIDRQAEPLADLAAAWPDRFDGRLCDLADAAAVERLTARLEGPFDLVVLNAGISATGRFEAIPAEAHARLLRVNALAPMLMARELVARGLMAKRSRMVFVSSLSHVTGYPGAASYAASKDAVAVYARSVRPLWRRRGVRVTCLFPGPLRTAHAERYAPPTDDPQTRAARRTDPRQVARMILNSRGQAVIFPGAGANLVWIAGALAPRLMTRMMRRAIFEKLDHPQL